MRLRALRELIDEAYGSGAIDGTAGLVVLVRNPEAPIESEAAWDESLVVDIHVDSEGGDLDLVTDSLEAESRMTLTELSIRLSELPPDSDEFVVFVRGGLGTGASGRFIDSPVVASAIDPEEQKLVVIVEFEGYEDALG